MQQNNLTILLAEMPAKIVEKIKETFKEVNFVEVTKETVITHVENADALVAYGRVFLNNVLTKEFIEKGQKLKWIHAGGADINRYMIPELKKSTITFTNGKVLQGPHVSDHAWALLLTLARNIHLVLRNDEQCTQPRPIELQDKKILIVGCGGVGMLLAHKAAAHHMEVHVLNDKLLPFIPVIKKTHLPEELMNVLPQMDIVIVAAPHTKDTRKMFSQEQFEKMKDDSIFINVSRGQLVDTDALTNAIDKGKFRAVGLDVTDPEPLPSDHPLRNKRNVIITPHLAGLSDKNHKRRSEHILDNIKRFVTGLELTNIVDKQKEY